MCYLGNPGPLLAETLLWQVCKRVLMQGIRAPAPSRLFPITMTASGLSPEDENGQLLPDKLSELGRRQEPMFREEVGPALARVGDGARLLVVERWFSGCCRRLLSEHRGSEGKDTSRETIKK